ncbi:hypothetical protein [Metabacillus halosaccharovorans]|nr:hypothetical protein [Metabacillus halosaccharovorans]
MSNYQIKVPKKEEYKGGNNGYKVIEVNVSTSTDSLYAVVTPVKKM